MLPLVAYYLSKEEYLDYVPRFIREHFENTCLAVKARLRVQQREAVKIAKALQEAAVRFVATKGIVFSSTVYACGTRLLRDLDFMIHPEDSESVLQAMKSIGYQVGEIDQTTHSIRPMSRRALAAYKLNRDHLPEFVFMTGDETTPFQIVDFATSLTWTRSEFVIPIEEALKESTVFSLNSEPPVQVPCFQDGIHFIFTMLHLYREAWFEHWLKTENDVTLMKFSDLVRLWQRIEKSNAGIKLVESYVRRFNIIQPAAWVLGHLDQTLGMDTSGSLGIGEYATEEWLHSASSREGKRCRWSGSMRDRLRLKRRGTLFTAIPPRSQGSVS